GTTSLFPPPIYFFRKNRRGDNYPDTGGTFYVGKLKTWVHNTGPCELPEGYFGNGGGSGAKGISPVVTAEGKIGDAAFTDVNQTARPVAQANPDEPTLIADRVTAKTEATGKSLPNGNMADAHAEIGVIQQAYNAGKTQGADMAMSVAGKDVCGFCKGDIAAAAEKSGLSSLTIQAIDDVTGLPKKYNWVPGMRSIKEVP
ncbi:hypothetical protein, partial [Pseudomonas syringae]|uniref:cytidine deaminase-like fold-containing protein n=2 Tax=Pseudomonas TaxID=286 RepID=UPI000ABC5D6F